MLFSFLDRPCIEYNNQILDLSELEIAYDFYLPIDFSPKIRASPHPHPLRSLNKRIGQDMPKKPYSDSSSEKEIHPTWRVVRLPRYLHSIVACLQQPFNLWVSYSRSCLLRDRQIPRAVNGRHSTHENYANLSIGFACCLGMFDHLFKMIGRLPATEVGKGPIKSQATSSKGVLTIMGDSKPSYCWAI
ncbi:hypothetical protein GOP47_0001509 [Adiantum capillus-veneris]|uniref:Uncharacterized protein n=1 Tax=Adiantum capillus-veneris TaxID=13818 RepID=A0A9D4V8D9_ADICA|nr:hypothetical protein GOP47_0001509 [Adiantum capillus-veneris]